jgi:peptide chain release factor subunit 1
VAPDLARLATLHDPESRDTFLTLYADFSDPRHEDALERRAKAVRAALPEGERKAFGGAWEQARRLLGPLRGRGARGAAVFVAPLHGLEEAHPLAQPIPTAMVVDSGPYLRPLARFLDEHEAFLLVVVDSESAAVYSVVGGKADLEHRRRLDLIGRHKKGGMSQMRYQRHRQGIKDKLHNDTADQLQRLVQAGEAERIVLAGPGPAKKQLLARLPPALAGLVIGVEDTESAEDLDLARHVALAGKHEAAASKEAVERLRQEVRRGEPHALGPFDCARAARDGRVDLLVVQKDAEAGGRKCEAHQAFFEEGAACPNCGSKGSQVDLLNEAVEWVVRSGAEVEFVDARDPFLREVGGIGALLRW